VAATVVPGVWNNGDLRLFCFFFIPLALAAQEVRVVSEFRRFDSKGELLAADREGTPREILSPAISRNAFSSFRIVMEMPEGADIWFEVGLNPDNAVAVTVYEESSGTDGKLRQVSLPYRTKLPPGATTATLWMDLWVARDAPVQRIKVEPQLYYDNHWYTYPMEARVVSPVVPVTRPSSAAIPPEGSPADASVRALARERLCGARPGLGSGDPSMWQFLRRNALQDLALAGPAGFEAALLAATGAKTTAAWCADTSRPAQGPEWYLRVRDRIYRAAGAE
jgi:hypothetical protein